MFSAFCLLQQQLSDQVHQLLYQLLFALAQLLFLSTLILMLSLPKPVYFQLIAVKEIYYLLIRL